MFNISPAPAALAKRASKALSSAKLMFSRCRPPLGLDLSALSPPRSYAICARFTVLSEAPIASAIAGCVIPPSRSSTIWMRWRRFGSPFQRSAVFNRRTWALVHLTISSPESDDQRESQAGSLAKGSNLPDSRAKRRFNQLWSRYEMKMPHSIIRGKNGRRHEVYFGAAPIRVEIYASEETVDIFVEADFEMLAEERRRFAIINIPRHLFSEATGEAARRPQRKIANALA